MIEELGRGLSYQEMAVSLGLKSQKFLWSMSSEITEVFFSQLQTHNLQLRLDTHGTREKLGINLRSPRIQSSLITSSLSQKAHLNNSSFTAHMINLAKKMEALALKSPTKAKMTTLKSKQKLELMSWSLLISQDFMNQNVNSLTNQALKAQTSSFGVLMMMEDMDPTTSASLVNKSLTSEESKILSASTEKILRDRPWEFLAFALRPITSAIWTMLWELVANVSFSQTHLVPVKNHTHLSKRKIAL
jgi:hypothetical protein